MPLTPYAKNLTRHNRRTAARNSRPVKRICRDCLIDSGTLPFDREAARDLSAKRRAADPLKTMQLGSFLPAWALGMFRVGERKQRAKENATAH